MLYVEVYKMEMFVGVNVCDGFESQGLNDTEMGSVFELLQKTFDCFFGNTGKALSDVIFSSHSMNM